MSNSKNVIGRIIIGGFGDDRLAGEDGNDFIFGNFGDDLMFGGGGHDFLFGGFGNDTLVGNTGDDRVFGGRGDDLLVWNNGDGSDLLNGGRGDDRVQVNFQNSSDLSDTDLQNDDVATFVEDGAGGVTFNRVAVNGQSVNGLFQLDIVKTETLETNFGGGDDVAALQGDVIGEIALELDGGDDGVGDANPNSAEAQLQIAADAAEDIATGDTLDLSALNSGARVDLDQNNQGVLQEPTNGGLTEEGFVEVDGVRAITNDFENVIGTDFNDVIFGNAQNNVLIGGDGDDALHPFGGDDFVDGGAGTDVLLLNGFANGQFVDVGAGIAGDLNEAGDGVANGAAINTFVNIENINGSSVASDVIIGDDNVNVISGLGGDDEVNARGGDDILNGNDGNDTLVGNLGDDMVFGGEGDDLLVWNNGDGSDLMNGGAGDDRVQVNFQQNTDLSQLDLQNDDVATFADDGAGGVAFNRVAVNGQSINGLFQLDIVETETLETNFGGGTDEARIIGDAATDITLDLDGGDGLDTIDFGAANGAVEINLAAGTFGDDDAATNFENVIGSELNDVISGDEGNNTLVGNRGDDQVFGLAGDDLLVWNNGDGSDLLNGGAGDDRVQVNFQQTTDGTGVDLQNDDVVTINDDDNGNITFNRVAVNGQSVNGLFQLDIEETETLEVNFGGGEDTAALQGVADDEITLELDGGDGVDTLDLSAVDELGGEGVVFNLETGEFQAIAGADSDDTAINFENVIGTTETDVITGSEADNIIAGGAGDDTFVVSAGDDTIADFEIDGDLIDVSGLGLSASDALALARNDGAGNTVLEFGDGDSLTLAGVVPDELSEDNFVGAAPAAAELFTPLSDDEEEESVVLGESEAAEVIPPADSVDAVDQSLAVQQGETLESFDIA